MLLDKSARSAVQRWRDKAARSSRIDWLCSAKRASVWVTGGTPAAEPNLWGFGRAAALAEGGFVQIAGLGRTLPTSQTANPSPLPAGSFFGGFRTPALLPRQLLSPGR